jgi:hypothetical protein
MFFDPEPRLDERVPRTTLRECADGEQRENVEWDVRSEQNITGPPQLG